jgi:hypothetical protein
MGEVANIGRSDIKPIVQGGSRDEQVMSMISPIWISSG